MESAVTPEASSRVDAIDQFRGLAILGMVLVNYLGGVCIAPAWLKHAPDVGLTVADLVAPLFILAIGLTYGLSARRRLAPAWLVVLQAVGMLGLLSLAGWFMERRGWILTL